MTRKQRDVQRLQEGRTDALPPTTRRNDIARSFGPKFWMSEMIASRPQSQPPVGGLTNEGAAGSNYGLAATEE
jgi:hypothetical protein